MIISATTEGYSTLTDAASYRVRLPATSINLRAGKNISSSRTISGGANISIWDSSIAGERRTVVMTLDLSTLQALTRVADSTVSTWLLRVQSRVFEVAVNLISSEPDRRRPGKHRVSLEFVFVKEETK